MESVFCLSLHTDYACRHSGACCRTWQVPAEPHVVEFVRVRYGGGIAAYAFKDDAESEGTVRIAHAHGSCVFRQRERCVLHSDGGAEALPVGCRHFPRVVLRDARGTFVALSHYCPTAAALLGRDGPLDVVEAPASLRVCEPLEGLDARDALPPLLRPGMLTDPEAYDAWERSVIALLGRSQTAGAALDAIERATDRIRTWAPGQDSLRECVLESFAEALAGENEDRRTANGCELRIVAALAEGAIADGAHVGLHARWSTAGGDSPAIQRLVLRYLAARVLGNWVAYQGRGLRTIVAWLRACHDVLRVLALAEGTLSPATVLTAVRRTDLLMLHSLDSLAFARAAAPLEERAA